MAKFFVSRTCVEHVAHAGDMELNCFDEATLKAFDIFVRYADVSEFVSLCHEWLVQEESTRVFLSFVDIEGEEFVITFTV